MYITETSSTSPLLPEQVCGLQTMCCNCCTRVYQVPYSEVKKCESAAMMEAKIYVVLVWPPYCDH